MVQNQTLITSPQTLSVVQSSFSSISATSTTSHQAQSATDANNPSDGKENSSNNKSNSDNKKKDDSNIFLDNLGKIFLSSIGIVLVMLLRSTRSNNSRSGLRDDMEANCLLDPLEIDDLRMANSQVLTKEVWDKIVVEVDGEFPMGEATYLQFMKVVLRVLRESDGDGVGTIQLGHLVDRVVIAELERRGSTVAERVDALYNVMLLRSSSTSSMTTISNDSNASNNNEQQLLASGDQVSQMIQHLQNTCQLVPDAQIVETNSKIPYQTYRVGDGAELTKRAREGYGGKKGNEGVTREKEGDVSLDEFYAILKSRTVCAWGECYVKKKGAMTTSDW
ncbi:predicted protein [Thalassiosira pseudonana CCMP1335]|uniref:Uncharacterized protein n=1 Tax=Thalassiosira pseudonana TaxID=35128 RepID=B8CAN2_THAPS|nr:predicted protein [Thalassiosira pseudonana CCMP1335]EED89711.1 predicted protein [Thalassiosira pseudonana CCMP1335]